MATTLGRPNILQPSRLELAQVQRFAKNTSDRFAAVEAYVRALERAPASSGDADLSQIEKRLQAVAGVANAASRRAADAESAASSAAAAAAAASAAVGELEPRVQDLEEVLPTLVSSDALAAALVPYVDVEELTTALADYVTWDGVGVLTGKTLSGSANTITNVPVTAFNGGTGAGVGTFLRGDGTWAVPPGGGGGPAAWATLTGAPTDNADLVTLLGGYATDGDVAAALVPYALETDLDAYVAEADLPAILAPYALDTDLASYQPLDDQLLAIAAVTPAADQVTYWTGASAAAQTALTSFGRDLIGVANAAAAKTLLALATVATTGAYADLTGKPALFSGAYADLTGKPTLFSGAYADLTGKPALAAVATSGLYSDLTGTPAPVDAASFYLKAGGDIGTGVGALTLYGGVSMPLANNTASIFTTNSTGSPAGQVGHLVLQARADLQRSIYFATGSPSTTLRGRMDHTGLFDWFGSISAAGGFAGNLTGNVIGNADTATSATSAASATTSTALTTIASSGTYATPFGVGSRVYSFATSDTDAPVSGMLGVVLQLQRLSTSGIQIAGMASSAGASQRLFYRGGSASAWGAWTELATLGANTFTGNQITSGYFQGQIRHGSGYMLLYPFSATYDDGTFARFYYDGNNTAGFGAALIWQRNDGAALAHAAPQFRISSPTGYFDTYGGSISGSYGVMSGTGSGWGGGIWGMNNHQFGGSGVGGSFTTGNMYGLAWLRASHSQAIPQIGEGIYVYQAGVLRGGIGTGGVAVNNGAATLPTYGFVSEAGLGMYRIGTGVLGWSTDTTESMRLTSLALGVVGRLMVGTTLPPAIGAAGDLILNRSGGDRGAIYFGALDGSRYLYGIGATLQVGPTFTSMHPASTTGATGLGLSTNVWGQSYISAIATTSVTIDPSVEPTSDFDVGLRGLAPRTMNSSSSLQRTDVGRMVRKTNTTAYSWTLSSSSLWQEGAVITLANESATGAITLVQGSSVTITTAGGATGNRTIGPNQTAVLTRRSANNQWKITGEFS